MVTAKTVVYVEKIPLSGTCPLCGAKLLVALFDSEGSTRIKESPLVLKHFVAYGGIKGKDPYVRRVCSGCFTGFAEKEPEPDEFERQCRYLRVADKSDKHWYEGMIERAWVQMSRKNDPFLESMLTFYRDFAARNNVREDELIPEGVRAVALNRIMHWAYDSSDQAILPKYLDWCKDYLQDEEKNG